MVSFLRGVLPAAALVCFTLASSAAGDSPRLDKAPFNQYQGNVIVVDFWASWCVPCRRSFPWLNDMHAKYAEQGLVVIGVNMDANQEDAATFLEDYPAAFKIHYDTEALLAREFGVEAMPSSFVIGRDGQMKARHLGFKVKRQEEYEAILVDALGEAP